MRGLRLRAMIIVFVIFALAACTTEQPVNVEAVLSQPKTYVGSDNCKMCHLEHYDS